MQYEWKEERERLDLHVQVVAHAAEEYRRIVAENRELYNRVQDLKGNIRVYCRVRPFLPRQTGAQTRIDFIGEDSLMIRNPTKEGKEQQKTFQFNKIFEPSASQEDVFLDVQPLIRSVLDGYNVCIFAYGQTGSGKTHTMTGTNIANRQEWGVNFRALHDLFEIGQSRKDIVKYEVSVQMVEIHNEQVIDLLCTDGGNKKLEIRNSQQNGVNVPAAKTVLVTSTMEVMELMSIGLKNRSVSATALNELSSRSHSILTVHAHGTSQLDGSVFHGCLYLIDLAGSERVGKSEVVGDRLREAQHINRSLSALGDVMAALAQKAVHVPYRNSKLTQLLQGSLGGQAKTLMFVHISPEECSYGETLSTLKFAERVANIELGVAQCNKETGEVQKLKEQISALKELLSKRGSEIEQLKQYKRNNSVEGGLLQKSSIDVGRRSRQPLEEMRNAEVLNSSVAPKKLPVSSTAEQEALNGSLFLRSYHGVRRDPNMRRVSSSGSTSWRSENVWQNASKHKAKRDLVTVDSREKNRSCSATSYCTEGNTEEISMGEVQSSQCKVKYVDEVSLLRGQEFQGSSRKHDRKKWGDLQTKRLSIISRTSESRDEVKELSGETLKSFVGQHLTFGRREENELSGRTPESFVPEKRLLPSYGKQSNGCSNPTERSVKIASASTQQSRRHSLLGSTAFGLKISSARSVCHPTIEATLAISSDGDVECHTKTSYSSHGGSSRPSKGWL